MMNSRIKARERSGDREKERERCRERSRRDEAAREIRERDRERDRERERDRDREREYDRERDRDRERMRKGRDRERERHEKRERERDQRERDRDHLRNRDKFYQRRDNRSDHSSSLPFAYSNDKVNNVKANSDRERRSEISRKLTNEWSECVSSTGKKYYYNSETGVSQWEKPKELMDDDDDLRKEDKYLQRRDKLSTPGSVKTLGSGDSEDSKRNTAEADSSSLESDISLETTNLSSQVVPDVMQDRQSDRTREVKDVKTDPRQMKNSRDPRRLNDVIESKNDFSSLKSNVSCVNIPTNSVSPGVSEDKRAINTVLKDNMNNEKVNSTARTGNSCIPDILSPSQVNLSNLPKLISQLANTHGLPDLSGLSPQATLKTIQQALQLTKQVKQRTANQSVHRQTSCNSPLNSTPLHNHGAVRESPSASLHRQASQPHSSYRNYHQTHRHHSQTHPHYSHHQSADGIRYELDLLTNKNWAQSPGSENSVDSLTRATSSITSIPSGIGSSSLKPPVPSLSPSLANYFREDLIGHVSGWQADHAERQAKRYAEEAHTIGSLNATRVSAELKMARSLVRLTEIQATLLEQRILFLRQQIKEVDEWKSQNASNFTSQHS